MLCAALHTYICVYFIVMDNVGAGWTIVELIIATFVAAATAEIYVLNSINYVTHDFLVMIPM
jgi:hypothetical protein